MERARDNNAGRLGGKTLQPWQAVWLCIASANRESAHFAEGERFNIGREDNRHLGFGLGIHYCLGAPLARLKARIALPRLLMRFPNLEPAGDPTFRPNFIARNFSQFPVLLQ